jgi:hypothetical protein
MKTLNGDTGSGINASTAPMIKSNASGFSGGFLRHGKTIEGCRAKILERTTG